MAHTGRRACMLIVLAVTGLVAVLFLVLAWKYWHGEWLRTLAGNTFASEDEMRGPYQRALGRRASVVCLIIAACVLAMTASTAVAAALLGEGSPKFDLLVRASAYVTTVVIGVSCVILCVVQWREHRSRERVERAGDPGLESDLKIEARQAIALVVIVVALEVVLPIAALSISS